MIKDKKISVIIPAYNEGQQVADLLKKVLNFSWIDEVIVVNDGSSDDTEKVCSLFPVKIISFKKNQGKAKAVEYALKEVLTDVIVLIDADLKGDLSSLVNLVKPVVDEQVDVTVAVLPISGGGFGLVRKLADFGLYFLTAKKMEAPLSGQRVISAKVVSDLLPMAHGFGLEIVMDFMMISKNLRFREIECNFHHRVSGKNIKGFLHRGKQFIDILGSILKLSYFNFVKNPGKKRW